MKGSSVAIGPGETILAADIQAIKDDVDAILAASDNSVTTSETTTSTSYTDLTTPGPAVTLTTGTAVLVFVGAQASNSASNASLMTVAVSGATTKAAGTYLPYVVTGTDSVGAARVILIAGLTAGSNTFTAKYRVGAGTGTWSSRTLIVIPLGV